MRLAIFLMMVLCCSYVLVMIWLNENKPVMIGDVEQPDLPTETDQDGHADQHSPTELTMRRTYGTSGVFCVPLPAGIRQENIFMENHYMDRELCIYVQGGDTAFYGENALYGDGSPILGG